MSSVPEDPAAVVAPSRARVPAASAMAVGGPARLAALSDGVHAIAMTLLVLGLSLPEGTRPGSTANRATRCPSSSPTG
ncbi:MULTISPECIES: TMEM175 family protein [Streptomyces diastaticus group]|uniref:TMEM175 family protein n=1 Tax=Streptomyces diastaticus group TaxID=2849069 RepID=UPI00365C6361|nr:TMEM175 family protein [Streptomyces gougerotii]